MDVDVKLIEPIYKTSTDQINKISQSLLMSAVSSCYWDKNWTHKLWLLLWHKARYIDISKIREV